MVKGLVLSSSRANKVQQILNIILKGKSERQIISSRVNSHSPTFIKMSLYNYYQYILVYFNYHYTRPSSRSYLDWTNKMFAEVDHISYKIQRGIEHENLGGYWNTKSHYPTCSSPERCWNGAFRYSGCNAGIAWAKLWSATCYRPGRQPVGSCWAEIWGIDVLAKSGGL